MNVYDSARMAECWRRFGYAAAASPEGADLVILNTCHIREKAAEKVFSELGTIRRLKEARARQGGRMIVAVAGCVAQAEGAEILDRAPFVDIVFGPQAYHRLPEMVARATAAGGRQVLDTSFPAEPKFDHLPETSATPGGQRLSHGPGGLRQVLHLLRRALYARRRILPPGGGIIAEAGRLVAAGAREITLLGQNVNAYHGASPGQAGRVADWAS